MNKKTIIAAVLSMAIILGTLSLKNKFFPPAPIQTTQITKKTEQENKNEKQDKETQETQETKENKDSKSTETETVDNENIELSIDGEITLLPLGEKAPSKNVPFETDIFDVTFSTKGGVVKSIKLKEHEEKDGSPVEMINTFDSDQYSAFNISFNEENNFVKETFNYKESGKTITFFKDFYVKGAEQAPFRMEKIYQFSDDEYCFELIVNFKRIAYTPSSDKESENNEADSGEETVTDNGMLPFNRDKSVYSLNFGPQIGPAFAKLSKKKGARSREFRKFAYMKNAKRENVNLKKKETRKTIKEDLFWAGINGKYFSVIIKPNPSSQKVTFSSDLLDGITDSAQLIFTSETKATDTLSDSYIVYCGPNQKSQLELYNSSEKNDFELSEQKFEEIIGGFNLLGWLEWLIRQLLDFIYGLIPNYGIAIILATIIIKLALFPVTHKSYESTSKMQKIQPKVAALKEKFKDKPQELNAATMELYKQEGVNPMGGCLPMLLQMPFLFAFFGLLSKHFPLRNAVFIPGWITDLSGPETIFTFGSSLPVLGSELHLLPFIYLVVQLLTTKITQANSAQASSNTQMKLMTYGMPIFFFFIMYDMPSGLLIYWTMSNIITVVQQVLINKLKNKS